MTLTDRGVFDPPRTGLTLAHHLRKLYGPRFEYPKIQTMLVNDAAYRAWLTAEDPSALDLRTPASFLRVRSRHLLYE